MQECSGGIMTLTVDIGNSIIGLALFKDKKLIKTFSLETRKGEHYDQYFFTISNLLLHYDLKLSVEQAIVASVVPFLTPILARVVENLFNIKPLVLEQGIKSGISLKVDHPLEVGADIIACAAGAFAYGPGPFIIIDLGTANKYIYVDEHRTFHGVAISSGLTTSFAALINDADQLLSVPLSLPKKVLGKNTKDSLASGALYGLISEVEGFVHLIEHEVGRKAILILTGGNAEYIKDVIPSNYIYEPALVHYGLLAILERNHEK